MIHITLALVSCFASLLNRADGLRCRLVTSSQRLLDGVVVVVVGALKTNVLENYNNVHLQLPAPPTKTLPTYIPASPTLFVPYSPPLALFPVLAFFTVIVISILSAALAKLGVLQAVRKSLAKATYSSYDGVKTFFVFLVSIPLFVTATSKIYTPNWKSLLSIHVWSGKQRNGTRLLSFVLFGRPQATTALLNAYGRIVVAIVAGLNRVLELSGYHANFAQPSQVLPGSTCMLHPELPWYDIPQMVKTAFPGTDALLNTPLPRRSCPEFWGSRSWKHMTSMKVKSTVLPGQLQLVDQLGSGGFGDVVQVWSVERREMLAVKRIRKRPVAATDGSNSNPLDARDTWTSVCWEIAVHRLMAHHPAFPNLHGTFHDRDFYFLVMDCGVASFAQLSSIPDRATALSCGWQLVSALQALHERGIVHLDVKPANLLLSADDQLLLIDYGMAHVFNLDAPPATLFPHWHAIRQASEGNFPLLWPDEENPHILQVPGGTPTYMSQAALDGEPCSYGADLWALGRVIVDWLIQIDDEEENAEVEAIDDNFFERIFATERPLRFESWRDIMEHPIWNTVPAAI